MVPFLLCLFLFALVVSPQSVSLPQTETLSYSVEWRLITAGKGRMTWSAAAGPQGGWEANLHLESTGLVSKLFKVNDDYSSHMAPDLCGVSSHLKAEEGKRRRETNITFDRESKKANYLERDLVKNAVIRSNEIDVPACVHDVVGGLYYLRTLNLEPGQHTEVPVTDGKKSVMARIEAQQRETIKTPAGSFRTIRYEAFLFNDVLYRRSGRLYFWLSDDRRRLPVQIRVRLQFAIGTITLQLEKTENEHA
jgi:hypothetical protein